MLIGSVTWWITLMVLIFFLRILSSQPQVQTNRLSDRVAMFSAFLFLPYVPRFFWTFQHGMNRDWAHQFVLKKCSWWFKNPTNHLGCAKPSKQSDIYHINWLAMVSCFFPSTVLPFVWLQGFTTCLNESPQKKKSLNANFKDYKKIRFIKKSSQNFIQKGSSFVCFACFFFFCETGPK